MMRRSPMKRTGFKRKAVTTASGAIKPASRPMKSSKPAATATEKRHLGRVAALGCIVCSHCNGIHGSPAIVHHIRSGQGKMRAPHMMTLPLCPEHHQFSGIGVHDMGRAEFERMYGISETGLLLLVLDMLGETIDAELHALNERFSNFSGEGEAICEKSKIFQSAAG